MSKQSFESAEEGSGSLLALGLICLLLILLTAITGLIGLANANQKATTAADLSALAAADAARGIRPGDPCQVAEQVAQANSAQLTGCSSPENLEGIVDVRVTSQVQGPFAFLGPAESVARAGPPAEDSVSSAP